MEADSTDNKPEVQENQSSPPPAVPAKMDVRSVNMQGAGGGAMFMPKSMQEVVDMAQLMARSDFAIPPRFRMNPGACLAVIMQALRWEGDPFAVIGKAYVTKDKGGNERISYEAQLVAAIINTRGPFKERPFLEFEGEGEDMLCRVSATIKGEDRVRELKTPKVKDITVKNSPLWKADTEQQLSYYALRSFGRRVCPEVIMGIYTPDEIQEAAPIDVTPSEVLIPPRPQRSEFERANEAQTVAAESAPEAANHNAPPKKQRTKKAKPELTPEPEKASEPSPERGGPPEEVAEFNRGADILMRCSRVTDVPDLRDTILESIKSPELRGKWEAICEARIAEIKGAKK